MSSNNKIPEIVNPIYEDSRAIELKEKNQQIEHNNLLLVSKLNYETEQLELEKKKFDLASSTYKKIFYAICIYIILVLLLLAGNKSYFNLTDAVLIALLTTTTANIIGVLAIASNWLYSSKK